MVSMSPSVNTHIRYFCKQCRNLVKVRDLEIGDLSNCSHCDESQVIPKNAWEQKDPPDYIPKRCGDCEYWSRTGWFDPHRGKCSWYSEVRYTSHFCIEYRGEKEENINLPDCPKCSEPQTKEAIYCKNCGAEISPIEKILIQYCEECHRKYDETDKFCEKCGNELKEIEVEKNGKVPSKPKKKETTNNNIQQDDDELGFGWGNFLIGIGFFQGGIALLFGVIGGVESDIIPNRGVALLISAFALGSAFGLYHRRIYGLYMLYGNLIMNIFFGIISVYKGDEYTQFYGFSAIVISVLWGMYFKKREGMFT